ncbi:hypothetical protein ABH920_002822 [Catenulispora sp. EB89]|uniref:hypothetical protein n=1 Tax=Catenulispora sp. EB89 TaxID=3156257 RepID=UPI003515738A
MSRRKRSRAFTSVFLLVVLTAAGCASASAGKTGSSSAPAPASGGSGPSISPSVPTGQQLGAALLTAADLGGNFVATGPGSGNGSGSGGGTGGGGSSGGGAISSSGCPALDTLVGGGGSGLGNRQEADFSAGATGPFLDEVLVDGSPGAADAGYAQLSSALASCKSWTVTSGDVSLTFGFTPITFSSAPDTTAVRLDGAYQGFELNGYIVCEELSPVVLGYVFFQIGSGSSQVAYVDFSQAVAKVEQVLSLGTASPVSV